MQDWDGIPEIECDPDILSGAWVFRNTRIPVAALFENLRDGATVEEFLDWFPGVTYSQVKAVLNLMTAYSTRERYDSPSC